MAKAKKKSKAKRKSNKKKKNGSFLGKMFKFAFLVGFWCTLIVAAICAYYATELPDITQNATFERRASITVKAADGTIIGRYGDHVGDQITIDEIPEHLKYAVISIEDRRFYYHFGLDPIGLARAFVVNAQQGRVAQGGSTITQQLAKNLFLSRERKLKRKIQEAMLAFWMEWELTKDEILAAYLNRVYLGGGTFGVDAASKLYFNKPVTDITLEEAATLAGLLKAPSTYSPIANPQRSRERTQTVLNAMVDAGHLDPEHKKHKKYTIPTPRKKPSGNAQKYYSDWIVDEVNKLIGNPEEDLIIETTMNIDSQNHAQDLLSSTLRKTGENKKISQGSIVVMRPNGAVVALVGGKDYNQSQFNRATQAQRQPGSSFKPFTYLAALEAGWRPEDLVMDEEIKEGRYRPKNFGHKYYGEVTIEEALTLSLNTIAFQLIKDIGPQAVVDVAQRLGVESEMNADLSLALGTNLISPLELTGAYASIANGGVMVKPWGITKITTKSGTVYYERKERIRDKRVVNPRAIGMLQGMMGSVIQHGTGQNANFGSTKAAGKTGTSQDNRDAWFIGFTDRLVTSVWLGNDNNSSMRYVTGGAEPAKLWRQVMAKNNSKFAPFRFDIPAYDRFESIESLLFSWGSFGFGDTERGARYNDSSSPEGRMGNGRFGANRIETLRNDEQSRYERGNSRQRDAVPDRGRYND